MSNASAALNSEYAIVRSSTEVHADEVERADLEVLEVAVRWGRTTLGVAHVKPGESLRIGEDDGGLFLVPAARLGSGSFTLIENGMLKLPALATGTVERTEGEKRNVAELRALSNGVELAKGTRARLVLAGNCSDDDIIIHVARVAAGRETPRRDALKKGIFGIAACSFVAHLAIAASMSVAPGASLDDDTSPLDKETSAKLTAMYRTADMREIPKPEATGADTTKGGGEQGGAHTGAPGVAGKPGAAATDAAYAVKGPPETKEQRLANIKARIESNNYAALGALQMVFGANSGLIDPNSAFAESVGNKMVGYEGHILGTQLGDAYGTGLGLNGPGNGGGGPWDGLGIGIGPWMGHGPGDGGSESGWCPEGKTCTGGGVNALKRKPGGAGHPIDTNVESVSGSLPREIVKRIVRANFPAIGQCYQLGLRKDPELKGVVTTRFIIDTTGAVETANLQSSSLNDTQVAACVVGVFRLMSFPAPENGKALVTYPIDFQKD